MRLIIYTLHTSNDDFCKSTFQTLQHDSRDILKIILCHHKYALFSYFVKWGFYNSFQGQLPLYPYRVMTLYFAVTISSYSHTEKYSQPNSHRVCLILDVHFRTIVWTHATIDRTYPIFPIHIPEGRVNWQNFVFSTTPAHWSRLDFSK